MSLFHTEAASCPACGAKLTIDVADSVNADRRPDLASAILDNTFQKFACGGCGRSIRLNPSLTYLHAARRQWLLALPCNDRPFWESFEQGAREIFDDIYGEQMPGRIRELGRSLQARVVFGWSGLREKLLAGDLGISDVDLELLKLAALRAGAAASLTDTTSLRLLSGNAKTLQFGWVEDADEAIRETFEVPRDLLDELQLSASIWDQARAELQVGMFVDLMRLLVEPELPVAA